MIEIALMSLNALCIVSLSLWPFYAYAAEVGLNCMFFVWQHFLFQTFPPKHNSFSEDQFNICP